MTGHTLNIGQDWPMNWWAPPQWQMFVEREVPACRSFVAAEKGTGGGFIPLCILKVMPIVHLDGIGMHNYWMRVAGFSTSNAFLSRKVLCKWP